MRSIKVGDRDVTVEEPSIYKTELIGDKLATVGKDAPEIMSELGKFHAQYERDNVVELPRLQAMVQVPHLVKDLSEADWNQIGQKVRLPRSPSTAEQVLGVLPTVFTKARKQALELVALLMVPNEELSHDDGQVKERMDTDAEWLRHNAKPSELISLFSECTEVIKEVIDAHKDELGKLREFWQSLNREQSEPQTEHEAALKEAEEAVGAIGVSQSPTDSPLDTDGDTERSHTKSVSETPSPSSVS